MSSKPTIAEILHIESVAIVGVSGRMGYYWPHSMLQWPHDLKVWLISRSGGEFLGQKIFKSLSEIPERIDYAILSVPWKAVPDIAKECAEKGVKGVTIFTSGYSELGTEEGKQRELELSNLVQNLPLRVFGPNCMGLMSPKMGFAFMPSVKRLSGNVGLLSQSGGVVITTYTSAVESGVGISKIFSYGNAIDIKPAELLNYFESDDETEVVGVYIEGTQEGKELLDALAQTSEKKPVVVIKGGRSEEGSRAVSSHTGALAGNNEIWKAMFRQANVVTVDTVEDLVATLGVFSKCAIPQSRNVGMIAISGGTSVIYTDLCVEMGLKVPQTSPDIASQLRSLIMDVGNSVNNPIDLAVDYYEYQTMKEVIQIAGKDPKFDSLIIQADVHNIHQVALIMEAADAIKYLWKTMAEAAKMISETERKPVLIAIPEVAYPEPRKIAWDIFVEEGLPVFRNIREAVGALSRVCNYNEVKESRKKTN